MFSNRTRYCGSLAPREFRLMQGDRLEAEFIERPNRFLVRAQIAGIGIVEAFMPNPGRLGELLIPGASLILENAVSANIARKTAFTVQGVLHDGSVVCLNTLRTNEIARFLVNEKMVPGMENVKVLSSEVTRGHSRFDFLVKDDEKKILMEVKSVTLCGNRVAMFPDAVTDRGSRHLRELAALSAPGVMPIVLFVVQGLDNDFFVPDYHTDLIFAQTMLAVRSKLRFVPISIGWDSESLSLSGVKLLKIPWDLVIRQTVDKGVYIIVLKVRGVVDVSVGSLGNVRFYPGYYLYIGSGMNGLSSCMSRHLKKRKNLHWHIDYLVDVADDVRAYPIRGMQTSENHLSERVSEVYKSVIPGFGSSDSRHETHLFFSPDNPSDQSKFHELLGEFRFVRP